MHAGKIVPLITVSFLLVCFTAGQSSFISENASVAGAPEPLKGGVVVESVTKHTAAEEAGLKEGDILLTWTRGDTKGKIESPFDLVIRANEGLK
ncbi:MAG TPA: hypothetical protein VGJ30_07250 [Candidatus Angelobacter sp.]|jgi:S1-C subfamily serine protease